MRASFGVSVLAGLVTLATAFPPFEPHHPVSPDGSTMRLAPPSGWPNISFSAPCKTESHSRGSILTITETQTLSRTPVVSISDSVSTTTISSSTDQVFTDVFPSIVSIEPSASIDVFPTIISIESTPSIEITATPPLSSIFSHVSSLLGNATFETAPPPTTLLTSTINITVSATLSATATPVESVLSEVSSVLSAVSSEIAATTMANATATTSPATPAGLTDMVVVPTEDGSLCQCSIHEGEEKLCARDCECCNEDDVESCCCTPVVNGLLGMAGGLGFCSTACCKGIESDN
ncbi:hypothetical protein PV04_08281 [Phialophora macrospora]|uniref:Extracellular membrane protein CFEM domain-containing protein n=1 Tax=Phialophora macrospora TaxID=1851006 RepID=A0A0D2CLG8_9EURO|nr:hypothetical protein PV04_08281 [Phialophora macrospora]